MEKIDSKIGNRVIQYPDGKYRWTYEVPMLSNPTILMDVFRVLGISLSIVWLFNVTLIGCEGDLSMESLWSLTWGFLLILLGLFVLGYIAYIIVAWIYGWKYVVLFTMDEKELVHQQMPRQVKKAVVIGALTSLMGLAAGRPGVVGTGLLASSHTKSTSRLADVARIVARRRFHLIKLNQLLNKNRVYVPDEDFDFVYQFLCQHCTKAKRK